MLGKILSEQNQLRASKVMANYAKRMLEKHYDQLFRTGLGKSIKSQLPWRKKLIEFLMYAANVALDEKISSDTPFGKFVSEIFSDMPPEIAKRMINGGHKPQEKEDFFPSENSHSSLHHIRNLLTLSSGDKTQLSNWLERSSDAEKVELREILSTLAGDEIDTLDEKSKQELSEFATQQGYFRKELNALDNAVTARRATTREKIEQFKNNRRSR